MHIIIITCQLFVDYHLLIIWRCWQVQVQIQVQVQVNLFCQYKYDAKTSIVDVHFVARRLARMGATRRYIITKMTNFFRNVHPRQITTVTSVGPFITDAIRSHGSVISTASSHGFTSGSHWVHIGFTSTQLTTRTCRDQRSLSFNINEYLHKRI